MQSADGTTQRTFVLVDGKDLWHRLTLVRLDDDRPDSAALTAMWVSPQARDQRAATPLCDHALLGPPTTVPKIEAG